MTATTSVTIRLGRDWCQADGHKSQNVLPADGVFIGNAFVCWACLAAVNPEKLRREIYR